MFLLSDRNELNEMMNYRSLTRDGQRGAGKENSTLQGKKREELMRQRANGPPPWQLVWV